VLSPKLREVGTVFSDWGSYIGLFDQMWGASGAWRTAQSFEQMEEQIRAACPGLVGGNEASEVGGHGFAALAEALAEEYGDRNAVAARIRFAALCRPAADHGLPAEWSDYFVAEDASGRLVYSSERFAEPAAWKPVDAQPSQDSAAASSALARDEASGLLYDADRWYLEDGTTVVELDPDNEGYARDAAGGLYHLGKPADPMTSLFDRESGRWRRGTGSGEYEYHHDADQVWERRGEGGLWLRLHEGTGTWLVYDAPSMTWLSDGQWLPGDSIGVLQIDEAQRDPAVAEAEAEGETPAASSASEQGIAALAEEREAALRAVIADVRAAGFTSERVSDAEIEELFDQRVLEGLQGGGR